MNDAYDLQRFVRAQDPVYDDAIGILRQGMMCTPYMEFIFPRLTFGRGEAGSEPYAITSLDNDASGRLLEKLGFEFQEVMANGNESLKLYLSKV